VYLKLIMTHDRPSKLDISGEFKFLFEGLERITRIHPPRWALEEYVRRERPEGIDPDMWPAQAISAHLGLCPPCEKQVERLRRREQILQLLRNPIATLRTQFVRNLPRWRQAYQYAGVFLLLVALFLLYTLWQPVGPPQPPEKHPLPPPSVVEPTGGLSRRR
jgi:hypothetical protein